MLERLGRLDDRFVPAAATRPSGLRWRALFIGLAIGGFIAFLVSTSGRGEPAEPLGFHCVQPEQRVTEDVLGLAVDASGASGGLESRQSTSYWRSEGRKVVLVTCTSVSARDLAAATPNADEPGHVDGSPPFVLGVSQQQDYASEMRFVHESATVVIEVTATLDETQAREIVDSWDSWRRITAQFTN